MDKKTDRAFLIIWWTALILTIISFALKMYVNFAG